LKGDWYNERRKERLMDNGYITHHNLPAIGDTGSQMAHLASLLAIAKANNKELIFENGCAGK